MPSPKSQKPCPLCGKPMHRQSPRCRECWLKEHERPGNYLDRTCKKCGKPFRVHKIHVERGQGNYCSRACARSGSPTRKKAKPILRCSTCGATFDKFKAEIRKNRGKRSFCSPECWYSFNQRENHYLWEGGQHERMNPEGVKWRKAVLKRDQKHCRLCHANRRLEAHHIYPFAGHPEKRWDVSNGITLCHDCHVKFRHREMEYVRELAFIASVPIIVWN
jgi:5-methylcytosine-specific restriction endonuclease McrA